MRVQRPGVQPSQMPPPLSRWRSIARSRSFCSRTRSGEAVPCARPLMLPVMAVPVGRAVPSPGFELRAGLRPRDRASDAAFARRWRDRPGRNCGRIRGRSARGRRRTGWRAWRSGAHAGGSPRAARCPASCRAPAGGTASGRASAGLGERTRAAKGQGRGEAEGDDGVAHGRALRAQNAPPPR
jgi:hypothetical protein